MYIALNRGTTGGNLPLEQFAQLAHDAGFPAADVDLHYGVQHGANALRDLFAQHHLKFGGWGLHDWRSTPEKAAEGLAEFKKIVPIAGTLHIDSCATWIMPSADRPFLDNWNFHVERLTPIARVLADHGLRLGLEFVAPYHLHRMFKHEFIFTPGLMLELAAAIGPNVGLLVDCFHLHCAGQPWEYLASLPKEKIVLAHLNDAPKVPVNQVKDGERLLPGEGAIDAKAYLAALAKTGYAGPVALEVFNADLRAMPAEAAAKKAWAACRDLL